MNSLKVWARDPFVHFIAGCFLLPPVWDMMGFSDVITFFLHWSMVFTFLGIYLSTKVVRTTQPKWANRTSASDDWVARWYLLNGWVIHILLDGLTGVFKAHPTYAYHYDALDKRYGSEFGTVEGSYVHIISSLELFVYGPMCIYLYYAIHHRRPERDVLEVATCVCQLFGTVVYLIPEVITGNPSFIKFEWVLTPVMLKDFWFAVVLGNLIYFSVPTYLCVQAWSRLSRASSSKLDLATAEPRAESPVEEEVPQRVAPALRLVSVPPNELLRLAKSNWVLFVVGDSDSD